MNQERILLDTNVLLAVADGFDLFGELRTHYPHKTPSIMEGTLGELEKLSTTGTGAQKAAARLALSLVREEHLNMVPHSANHVDTALLEEAQASGAPIVTIDKELLGRAREAGVEALTVRQRRRISPAGP